MSQAIRVGIIGGGWPGSAHAKGYHAATGFKMVAVADLIPSRRRQLMQEFSIPAEYDDAEKLLADKTIDAVSICLPNYLHAPMAKAALKAGKHVLCEKPPATSAKEASQMAAAAEKSGKVLLYGFQRRFGGAEQAARQAIEKGYAGDVYHARASWTRTRGIPIGTGWFTDKTKSGGGSLIDIGVHMLDLAWHLLGQPKPISVYGVAYQKFAATLPQTHKFDVDDSAFAMIRFEGGKSMELASSWALNQPPQQNGTICRLYGDKAAVEVYTPEGATLYRNFDAKGAAKANPLKPPKTVQHAAMMRHFRDCILGKAKPFTGPREGVVVMQMLDAIYKSSETGKSVDIR
jgi:predicted dehydrogenase